MCNFIWQFLFIKQRFFNHHQLIPTAKKDNSSSHVIFAQLLLELVNWPWNTIFKALFLWHLWGKECQSKWGWHTYFQPELCVLIGFLGLGTSCTTIRPPPSISFYYSLCVVTFVNEPSQCTYRTLQYLIIVYIVNIYILRNVLW